VSVILKRRLLPSFLLSHLFLLFLKVAKLFDRDMTLLHLRTDDTLWSILDKSITSEFF
jgi:hypothetical protein